MFGTASIVHLQSLFLSKDKTKLFFKIKIKKINFNTKKNILMKKIILLAMIHFVSKFL